MKPLSERPEKDPDEEAFLESLNATLSPFETARYGDWPEQYPTLHVIGLPRSGTTLLMQSIACSLNVSYINNFVARFWSAPVTGLQLAKAMSVNSRCMSFRSKFGRTEHLHEPHEFGYFWSGHLKYEDMSEPADDDDRHIDWVRLRRVLINMCHFVQRPIAFKGFLIQWHLKELLGVLPRTCFVYIRRDPVDTAMSILGMRRTLLGSEAAWASMKPKQYPTLKEQSCWRQVAGQVYFLERSLRARLRGIPRLNLVETEYDELIDKPDLVLERICDLLNAHGADVSLQSRIGAHHRPAKAVTGRDDEDRRKIEMAYRELTGRGA